MKVFKSKKNKNRIVVQLDKASELELLKYVCVFAHQELNQEFVELVKTSKNVKADNFIKRNALIKDFNCDLHGALVSTQKSKT